MPNLEAARSQLEDLSSTLARQLTADLQRLQECMQEQAQRTLRQLEQAAKDCTDRLLAEVARSQDEGFRKLPGAPVEAPTPGSFSALMSEPAIPVKVGGENIYVHKSVLEKMPYFEAMLKGSWRDADNPQVDLPCSASEFGLLLQRLYTGEVLGSPGLPVKDGATALRLAAAAGSLLIEDALPELPVLLRGSIVTAAECQAAAAAAATLPGALGAVLRDTQTPSVPEQQLQAMLEAAKTPAAQSSASQVLGAQRGPGKRAATLAATSNLMKAARTEAEVAWVGSIAREHLDCKDATEVFKEAPRATFHSRPLCGQADFKLRGLHEPFLLHLQRCAEAGCALEVLTLGFQRLLGESSHLFYAPVWNTNVTCTVEEWNALALDGDSCEGLAAALRASRAELPALAECLATMPTNQLAQMLSEEVVQALGPFVDRPVVALAASPTDAQRWISVERLAALPRLSQIALAFSLLPCLSDMPEDVVEAITALMTSG